MSEVKRNILISTVHAGIEVPEEIESSNFLLDDNNLFRYSDYLTDILYDVSDIHRINADVSKCTVDLDRFPADNIRQSTHINDGICPQTTPDLKKIYKHPLYQWQIAVLLNKYYYPFHREFENNLQRNNIKFVIDGHSMSSREPVQIPTGEDEKIRDTLTSRKNFSVAGDNDDKSELEYVEDDSVNANSDNATSVISNLEKVTPKTKVNNVGVERYVDIIIGNRMFTTCNDDQGIFIRDFFKEKGYSVSFNMPFQGKAIIGMHCYKDNVPGIHLEINRGLYFNEETLDPYMDKINKIRDHIEELVDLIDKEKDLFGV